jgi:hypothetical protein
MYSIKQYYSLIKRVGVTPITIIKNIEGKDIKIVKWA